MKMRKRFAPFAPWFERHKRSTWKPVVKNSDGALTDSKFSGTPYLRDGEWPICGSCKRPLQLFLQLNLSRLPKDAPNFGEGLLQFFFCTNEEACCYADWYGNPYGECQSLRIVMPDGGVSPTVTPEFDNWFPAKRIVRWNRSDDFPSTAEREMLGLGYGSDEVLRCPDLGVEQDATIDDYFDWSYDHAFRGNKLSGWPMWVQNVEYVDCPTCGLRMDVLVFQIAYDDNIPFMLGDGGIGQIIQCPKHKDALAFVWASG